MFHFGDTTVGEVKRYLAERGVPVRMPGNRKSAA
jgi:imidazole glycerol phosphate synthase subunit HisF